MINLFIDTTEFISVCVWIFLNKFIENKSKGIIIRVFLKIKYFVINFQTTLFILIFLYYKGNMPNIYFYALCYQKNYCTSAVSSFIEFRKYLFFATISNGNIEIINIMC